MRRMMFILKMLGIDDYYFLRKNLWLVSFPEEDGSTLAVPKSGQYKRSRNLYDQREILFRSIIHTAIKNNVVKGNIIDCGAQNGDNSLI